MITLFILMLSGALTIGVIVAISNIAKEAKAIREILQRHDQAAIWRGEVAAPPKKAPSNYKPPRQMNPGVS